MKKIIKIVRFFINLRDEVINTQCQLRMLRDEIRQNRSVPTILEKEFLSIPEAAIYISSTDNFIKGLIKNGDIDSYVSPYRGYTWVKRTDIDCMINNLRIMSVENRKIEAANKKRKNK